MGMKKVPYGQNLSVAPVGLLGALNPEPVASVVDCMRCIKGGLEDHTCLDFPW